MNGITPDKCQKCFMSEENLCMHYGYISCNDAINFCDTDEFLTCSENEENKPDFKPQNQIK